MVSDGRRLSGAMTTSKSLRYGWSEAWLAVSGEANRTAVCGGSAKVANHAKEKPAELDEPPTVKPTSRPGQISTEIPVSSPRKSTVTAPVLDLNDAKTIP